MARTKSEIDWSIVDDMLVAGCTGEEVAARLGIHADTLYNRIQDEYSTGFSAYRQQKIAKGDQVLREKLYSKARKGDTASLIFLAKVRLGMADKVEVKHSGDTVAPVTLNIQFRPPSDTTESTSPEPQKKQRKEK